MNPLTGLIPAKFRKYIYLAASVAATVYGIWQATAGNWTAFAAGLVSAFVAALAHGNVAVPSQVAQAAKAAAPVIADVSTLADAVAAKITNNATVKATATKKAAPAKKTTPSK